MEHPRQGRRSAVVQTALAVLLSGSLVLFTVLATSIGLRTGPRGGLRAVVPEGAAGITLPANRSAESADTSPAATGTTAPGASTSVASLPIGTSSTGSTSLLPALGPSDDPITPSAPPAAPIVRGGAGVAVGDTDEGPESRSGSLVLRSTEPTSSSTTTEVDEEPGTDLTEDETGGLSGYSTSTDSDDSTDSEVPPNVPNDASEDGVEDTKAEKNKIGPKKNGKKGNKSSNQAKRNKKGVSQSRSGPQTTKSTTGRAGGSKSSNSSQPKKSEPKSAPPPSKPAKKKSSGESDGGRPQASQDGEKKKIRRQN